MNMKYHIITFGCQMNKSDSERIKSILDSISLQETSQEEEADFILMNTCSVRQKGEDRVYSLANKFDRIRKKQKRNIVIGITGCMAGRDHDGRIRKKLPMVDLFFDIQEITQLPEMLSQYNYNISHLNPLDQDYLKVKPKYKNAFQAYIPIQTGCNQFCTYCVVPFSRGRERNRPLKEILDEATLLAEQGAKEITLLGQIVNRYDFEDKEYVSKNNPYTNGFAQLLWEINNIRGIERIHYTAPHPRYMDNEVIDALGLSHHLNFLHLPVQSGSNVILKRMNRQHTRELFIEKVHAIREKFPHIALGTDIIVGFCGETEEDFEQTVSLYKECSFDISYTAQYSPRTGTLAYKALPDDVPQEEKKRRWRILQNLMEEITYTKNQYYKEKVVSVLFEEYKNNIATGWSREMKKVQVKTTFDPTGLILDVQVHTCMTWLLEGEIITPFTPQKQTTKGRLPMFIR